MIGLPHSSAVGDQPSRAHDAFAQRVRHGVSSLRASLASGTSSLATALWDVQQAYVVPCTSSVADGAAACATACLGCMDASEERFCACGAGGPRRRTRDRERRNRGRGRGRAVAARGARNRAEMSFDFYDDWEVEDELLGGMGDRRDAAAGDEMDRLLDPDGDADLGLDDDEHSPDDLIGGHTIPSTHGTKETILQQPKRKSNMDYGTRSTTKKKRTRKKDGEMEAGKPMGMSMDGGSTTIIGTSKLGFLEGFTWWRWGKTLHYEPSAEHLRETVSRPEDVEDALSVVETRSLMPDEDDDPRSRRRNREGKGKQHARTRSSTSSSVATSDSFRSRGDLFASDGDDDAVPLDDEFAMQLERRTTASGATRADDHGSGRTRVSSMGGRTPASATSRSASFITIDERLPMASTTSHATRPLSVEEMDEEAAALAMHEDEEVTRKREAARQLAEARGLGSQADPMETRRRAGPDAEPALDEDFVPARLPTFGK